jgi:hypothetical protein
MRLVRPKLTYANVVSTLALVLVVGGGSAYAGFELGKESVDTKQLAKEAVTPAKLSKSAKSSLEGPAGKDGARGATGPQGPQGVKGDPGQRGEPGPAPMTYYAVVDEHGKLLRGKGISTVVRYTNGDYNVELFQQNASHCTWQATLGVEGGAPNGQIGTSLSSTDPESIAVLTYSANGSIADFPFQLWVFC